jgi:hypothetical protein
MAVAKDDQSVRLFLMADAVGLRQERAARGLLQRAELGKVKGRGGCAAPAWTQRLRDEEIIDGLLAQLADWTAEPTRSWSDEDAQARFPNWRHRGYFGHRGNADRKLTHGSTTRRRRMPSCGGAGASRTRRRPSPNWPICRRIAAAWACASASG